MLEIFALTLGALTDTIFRYALHLCLFGHLYLQNLMPLSDHHTAWPATGTTSYETLTWPGTAFFLPDFSSMTLPILPLYPKSRASTDRICFSVVNSFTPSLPSWQPSQIHIMLKTLSCPQLHLYDSKAHISSVQQCWGATTQMAWTNGAYWGAPGMEVVGFAQRLPLASTASLWALLVRICMEDLWMHASKNKLCWCYSTAAWA